MVILKCNKLCDSKMGLSRKKNEMSIGWSIRASPKVFKVDFKDVKAAVMEENGAKLF